MNKIIKLLILTLIMFFANGFSFAQKTYVVSAGIGKYQSDWCESVPQFAEDVKTLSKVFDVYRNSDIHMLLNKNATRSNILNVLKQKFSKAGPKDEIVFIYSGHGNDGVCTGYNINEVISYAEIQDIMKRSKAGRKIMLVQSCHAGSGTKNLKNVDPRDYRNSQNILFFLSSRPEESSWTYVVEPRSIFMQRLYEGLTGSADANSDRKITARELFNYVNPRVVNDASLINKPQHPQMFGNFADDLVILDLNKRKK